MKPMKHVLYFIYNSVAFVSAVALGMGLHKLMVPRYNRPYRPYRPDYSSYYTDRPRHSYNNLYDIKKEEENEESTEE